MIRGEIWTASGGGDFAGNPRPVVIVQSSRFDTLASATVCPFTGDLANAPLVRLEIEPDSRNGLKKASRIMVDKITTIPTAKLGARIGHLSDKDLLRINRALLVFLGLAD